MSEAEISELRSEMRQIRESLAETQRMARETRDVLLQARGGMAVLRWLLGGTLASALGAAALVYAWIKGQ
jgi:hypothetical protein